MNNINLIGRLTKDVEATQGRDKLFARFTIAVYRDQDHSDFIPCVAFGKTAETLTKYTAKGSQIGIEGRLQSGKYENQEGKTIYTLDVIVNRVELLGSKKEETSQAFNESSSDPITDDFSNTPNIDINTDDLPFY